MQKNFSNDDLSIAPYLDTLLHPEDPVLAKARKNCEDQDLPMIQVGAFDARHLEVLAASAQAKRAVEIGTLGGYSGISLLRGMNQCHLKGHLKGQLKGHLKGDQPHLYTFDLDAKHLRVASENFKHEGVLEQVSFYEGPALETLIQIEAEGPFDLVFIDADKVNYPHYLKWAEKNLRKGGILIADNVFGWGYLNSTEFPDPDVKESVLALREFNQQLANSSCFLTTFLPTGEGLALAVRV